MAFYNNWDDAAYAFGNAVKNAAGGALNWEQQHGGLKPFQPQTAKQSLTQRDIANAYTYAIHPYSTGNWTPASGASPAHSSSYWHSAAYKAIQDARFRAKYGHAKGQPFKAGGGGSSGSSGGGGGGGYSAPRTYRGAGGKIMQLGGGGGGGSSPGGGGGGGGAGSSGGSLNDAVNAVIAAQLAPFEQERATLAEQTKGNIRNSAQATQALSKDLRQSRKAQKARTAQQLAASARYASADDAAAADEHDYLQSVLGGQVNADASTGAQGQRVAGNVGYTSGMGLMGQQQQDFLRNMSSTTRLGHREYVQDSGDELAAAERDIGRRISAVRATAPMLRRQFEIEDRDFNLQMQAAQAAGLMSAAEFQQAQAEHADDMAYKYDALQNQRDLATFNGPSHAPKAPAGSSYASYKTQINRIFTGYKGDGNKGGLDAQDAPTSWIDAYHKLTAAGIPVTIAIKAASTRYPAALAQARAGGWRFDAAHGEFVKA